jgi:RecA-family ATPase
MILIDGIADFCNDPNDGKECFELVRKLHKLAVDHECVIVCVIHENPGNGGGKTRGHLGSHLDRKAETSLRLQKDTKTGVVEMWVERGRSCFIPRSAGIRFKWSDEAQMFVTLHASDTHVADSKVDKATRLTREVDLVFSGEEGLIYGMLVDKIMSSQKLAESTAKQRVADYVTLNLIRKNDDGFYQVLRSESVE